MMKLSYSTNGLFADVPPDTAPSVVDKISGSGGRGWTVAAVLVVVAVLAAGAALWRHRKTKRANPPTNEK